MPFAPLIDKATSLAAASSWAITNIPNAAESKKYNAVIALGAVIKGSTSHYDYVCAELSKGIASVSLSSGVPVLFGVLTTDTIEQAVERAGTKAGNKGSECAKAAIEMSNVIKKINL